MSGHASVLRVGGVACIGVALAYVLTGVTALLMPPDRRIIPVYAHADPAFQQAVHVVAGLALDIPDGILTYGAIGLWVAVVSGLGLRADRLPRGFAWLGFAAAGTYLAGVVGYAFALRPFLVVAIGVGGLALVPAWYATLGIVLGRAARRV